MFSSFLDDLEDERERMFLQISEYCLPKLGTIHILRKHIAGLFGPPSPLRKHVFSTENNQIQQYLELGNQVSPENVA